MRLGQVSLDFARDQSLDFARDQSLDEARDKAHPCCPAWWDVLGQLPC